MIPFVPDWDVSDPDMCQSTYFAAPTSAIDRETRAGLAFQAEQWVANEFDVLGRLWSAGVAVPYPVQRIGSELMVEYLGDDDGAAPRLVQVTPPEEQAADLFAQAVVNIRLCARRGVVHGDLSRTTCSSGLAGS